MKQVTTIIISLIIGFYTSATSQTKTFNLSDFSNKEWYAEFSTDTYPIPPKQGWRFSENGEVTSFIYNENGRHEGIVNFYLSNAPVTNFDYNKVGKTPQGKYIVTINKANYINNLEIISISPTRMCIRNLYYNSILNFTSD